MFRDLLPEQLDVVRMMILCMLSTALVPFPFTLAGKKLLRRSQQRLLL